MAHPQGKNRESGDEELEKIKGKLLKINQKVKKYCFRQERPRSSSGKEPIPLNSSIGQDISLEEMLAKLHAINDYIRDRALGKNVAPPVSPQPERRKEKISPEIIEERVAGIGEGSGHAVEVLPEETVSKGLPLISAGAKKKGKLRLGVGLDLGTAYIVASREDGEKRVFVKSERNAFLSVRCDNPTKELLTKLRIKYVALRDSLYVLGRTALELADIFGREIQRSMSMGILNPSEAESVPLLKLLIESILWPAREKEEVCCFSIPASPIDRGQDTIYHRGVFEGILKAIGFEPLVIDEGYAVVLSEMDTEDFTGIGVSCGAGMVNICASFKSVPVVSFSITRGGDWIDKSAASVLGVPVSRVTTLKEQGINIKNPRTREEEAIAIYYRNFIHYFLENMAVVFGKSATAVQFKKPADIVFAGGSAMVGGFLEIVKQELKSMDFGFSVGNVRIAQEPFTTVSRGCLFNAIYAGNVGAVA